MRTIFPSGLISASTSKTFGIGSAKGGIFVLDVTAKTSSPTLDVKFQHKDGVSGKVIDIPGASFAQKTNTGTDSLVIYPGVTAAANRSVATVLGDEIVAVATFGGTGDITFSLTFDEISES